MITEYRKCVVCGFNVMPQDERCANCGVLRPLESLKVQREDYSYLIALAIIGSLLLPALYFGSEAGFGGIVCCALPVGVVLIFLLGTITKAISDALAARSQKSGEQRVANRTSPYPESLMYKEGVIQQRILELSNRDRQIRGVLDRMKERPGDNWNQVRETLTASIETVKRQRARYGAKSVDIETVRLQNRIAPVIHNVASLSYEQIDARLKTIDEAQTAALKLGEELEKQRSILGNLSEIEEMSPRLSEIQESMRKLHDALVGRQAVLALKGITPLADALTPVSPPMTAFRESEVFNIQVAITDFSASFDELEAEYVRVQSEEDVAQKVSEIINRADEER